MAQNTSSYEQLLEQILELDPEEQSRLVEAITDKLDRKRARHSILELRGLGKEVWEGIDAKEYVARERAAWEE